MTGYEITAIVIAAIGLIISIISIMMSFSAHKISQGQIELEIHQLINQAQKDVLDISIVMVEKLPDNSKDAKIMIKKALNAAYERNLNAYEEACAKYLDNKVDKDRFKKNYHLDIRNLVQNEQFQDKINPLTSPYKAILKVYNEWNNLEK